MPALPLRPIGPFILSVKFASHYYLSLHERWVLNRILAVKTILPLSDPPV
jgi:hypothetical protein